MLLSYCGTATSGIFKGIAAPAKAVGKNFT